MYICSISYRDVCAKCHRSACCKGHILLYYILNELFVCVCVSIYVICVYICVCKYELEHIVICSFSNVLFPGRICLSISFDRSRRL